MGTAAWSWKEENEENEENDPRAVAPLHGQNMGGPAVKKVSKKACNPLTRVLQTTSSSVVVPLVVLPGKATVNRVWPRMQKDWMKDWVEKRTRVRMKGRTKWRTTWIDC